MRCKVCPPNVAKATLSGQLSGNGERHLLAKREETYAEFEQKQKSYERKRCLPAGSSTTSQPKINTIEMLCKEMTPAE